MSRLIKSKPVDDAPLKFAPMGQKPVTKMPAKPVQKLSKKTKKAKASPLAQKAAMALANKG